MKAAITKSLTVSLAVAAAIALPTAVKAEADNLSVTTAEATSINEEISTEYKNCFIVPGYGVVCF